MAMRGIVYTCRQMFPEDLVTAKMVLGKAAKHFAKAALFCLTKFITYDTLSLEVKYGY